MADETLPPYYLADPRLSPTPAQPAAQSQQHFLTPEMLNAAGGAFGVGEREQQLDQELQHARAQALRGEGYHYRHPGGAAFGGMAKAIDKAMAGYEEGRARAEQRRNLDAQRQYYELNLQRAHELGLDNVQGYQATGAGAQPTNADVAARIAALRAQQQPQQQPMPFDPSLAQGE